MLKYSLILVLFILNACSLDVNNSLTIFQLDSPFNDEHRDRAEQAFSKTVLIDSLAQIRQWHKTNGTELVTALNPGKERAAIQTILADLPCQPTEELLELWTLHNGTKAVAQPFIWYHDFLSVEQAVSEYKRLIAAPLIGWRKNWIPIFVFQDEWYFVECYDEPRKASPVGYYFLEDTEPYYVYLNITTMLETSAAWFNKNAVGWNDEQQGMEEDMKLMFEIYRQLNKGTRFPYAIE